MMSETRSALEAKGREWRESADRFRKAMPLGKESGDYGEGRAVSLIQCADELSALLTSSSSPEIEEIAELRAGRQFNRLTPGEAERLTLLAEECAEVIAAVAKIQRHGFESTNPVTLHTNPATLRPETNREALARELGHVLAAKRLLEDDIDEAVTSHSMERKLDTIGRWLHHDERGNQ